MNSDKKYIGTYHDQQTLLNKIDELKAEGYDEGDLYVVANDEDKLSMVRGATDVDLKSPGDASWMDKFKGFLKGKEPVRSALSGMGFSDEQVSRYYSEAQKGGMLLFADRDYDADIDAASLGHTGENQRHMDLSGANTTYNNANLRQRVGAEATLDRDLEHDTDTYKPLNGMDTGLDRNTTAGRNFDRRADLSNDDQLNGEEERLALHKERLNVDKETVQTGEVNVDKHVVTDQQDLDIPVTREEVYVERRPATDETVKGEAFNDGDSIHIPIKEERVDVTKRPVVDEEIVVGKREVEDMKHVSETVRREEADIDRTGDTGEDLDARSELDKRLDNEDDRTL